MITLIWINLIVCLVYNAGFWDSMDYYVNQKFPLRHLPYIFKCCLCQDFWLSLIWLIASGNFSLLGLVLCLVSAHLTKVVIPLLKVVEEWLLTAVEWLLPRK